MNKKNKKLSAIELGNKIRQLRKNKKLSQKGLAERIGTYPSHLGKMERGENAPGEEYRRKLEKELGNLGMIDAPQKEVVNKIKEDNLMEEKLITMASFILNSGTSEAAALHANIIAFYNSLRRSGHVDPTLKNMEDDL